MKKIIDMQACDASVSSGHCHSLASGGLTHLNQALPIGKAHCLLPDSLVHLHFAARVIFIELLYKVWPPKHLHKNHQMLDKHLLNVGSQIEPMQPKNAHPEGCCFYHLVSDPGVHSSTRTTT